MMRVVHVINSLSAGGAEVFVAQLSEAMARHCDVCVWTYCGATDVKGRQLQRELKEAGVGLIGATATGAAKLLLPGALYRDMRHLRPDIVHAHLEQAEMVTAMAFGLRPRRPLLVRTLHLVRFGLRLARIARRVMNGIYDFNVACGEAVLRSPELMLPVERSCAIRNGIRLRTEALDECSVGRLRNELGIRSDRRVFLSIGRMAANRQKAHDVMIEGFARSALSSVADLVFVGDGPDRATLEELASSAGVRECVFFAGKVVDPLPFILCADAVLLPSRFEGFPITGVECVCAGRPLIVSDIDELRPLSGPGSVICRASDAGDLARAMNWTVENLTALNLGARSAAHRYRSEFDIGVVANRYLSLYRTLMRERAGRHLKQRIPSPVNTVKAGQSRSGGRQSDRVQAHRAECGERTEA